MILRDIFVVGHKTLLRYINFTKSIRFPQLQVLFFLRKAFFEFLKSVPVLSIGGLVSSYVFLYGDAHFLFRYCHVHLHLYFFGPFKVNCFSRLFYNRARPRFSCINRCWRMLSVVTLIGLGTGGSGKSYKRQKNHLTASIVVRVRNLMLS